jgi:hypothetical protein
MAISSVSSTNPLDQLARSLVDRFDANKDGQLTSDEFSSFLSNFLNSTATPASSVQGITRGAVPFAKVSTKQPLEGFSASKLADLSHNSLKYRFGRVAENYSLSSVTDKASAEAVLNSMKSDLEAANVEVLDVKGDKLQLKDDSGKAIWIDVIRGAGAGGGAGWQWLGVK